MIPLQDAKNRFSALVEAALAGRPQEVSRRGKPAVVVLSAEDYRRLLKEATANRGSFVDHLMAFPGGDTAPPLQTRPQARPRDVKF
ncbi:MAG: type II toxin-antitoxin system Phd/YefM family antitoxin [Pseudomonadota bacterium]